MEVNGNKEKLGPENPLHFTKDSRAHTREYARALDKQDPLRKFANEFHIPSKDDLLLNKQALADKDHASLPTSERAIYLTGHSLGLQPRRTADYIHSHLNTWALKGVHGHFNSMEDSPVPAYVNAGDVVAEKMGKLLGALSSPIEEVAVMQTLTANLHLLMASFYRPDPAGRYKILVEEKAFPSDHYAIESQIRHHNLDPAEAMIVMQPDSPDGTFSTEYILSVIEQHASALAVILLPGVQYYTGQYLDIPTITAHAHSLAQRKANSPEPASNKDDGIFVGWDLAHAIGNVELHLHDWNVDFAVWCNYKYVNGGPGVIGGLFVHERHGHVDMKAFDGRQNNVKEQDGDGSGTSGRPKNTNEALGYRTRLAGWWGSDKASRFRMENNFLPLPGAAGYQLSNPSILDICSVLASLSVFEEAGMKALRKKSVLLTGYLEYLLLHEPPNGDDQDLSNSHDHNQDNPLSSPASPPIYKIITPKEESARGAQLSIRFFADPHQSRSHQQVSRSSPTHAQASPLDTKEKEEILNRIMTLLERDGIVVDHRRPDVIRVAPVPLYNSFEDVWMFVDRFKKAVREALTEGCGQGQAVGVVGGVSDGGEGKDAVELKKEDRDEQEEKEANEDIRIPGKAKERKQEEGLDV